MNKLFIKKHIFEMTPSNENHIKNDFHFHTVSIPKKNGKFRQIYIPNDGYKLALRKINSELKKTILQHMNFIRDHAFVEGKNCVTNACSHIGNRFVLSLDIENYFESIKWKHLKPFVDEKIRNIVCINDELKQGLPTSPLLSNLGFISTEKEILAFISTFHENVSYSRYADDLTFSFNDIDTKKILLSRISLILKSKGFLLNSEKIKLQDVRNGRAIITGVAIDDKYVYPTRKTLKKIRAATHQKNDESLQGLISWAKCSFPKSY